MASDKYIIFQAVEGFIGRVTAERTCHIWTSKEEFTVDQLIEVDLQRNPNEVDPAGVKVDAHRSNTPGGLTTIGPKFHKANHRGAVYLEHDYYKQCKTDGKIKDWPPPPDEEYQYMSIAIKVGDRKYNRYYGFKVEVVERRESLLKVRVFKASGDPTEFKMLWLDSADPTMCLQNPPPELATLQRTKAKGASTPLFISWQAANAYHLDIPKIPKGDGEETLPASPVVGG